MARIPIGAKPRDLSSMGNVRLRAVRRRHCVGGGGASVNFGRRRRAGNPKKSTLAAARRGVGGQNTFCKGSQTNFILSSKFSDDLFSPWHMFDRRFIYRLFYFVAGMRLPGAIDASLQAS